MNVLCHINFSKTVKTCSLPLSTKAPINKSFHVPAGWLLPVQYCLLFLSYSIPQALNRLTLCTFIFPQICFLQEMAPQPPLNMQTMSSYSLAPQQTKFNSTSLESK